VSPAAHPFLKQVETFPDAEVLFDHCDKFGFEGVSRLLAHRGQGLGMLLD
jgi:hypothetical protein